MDIIRTIHLENNRLFYSVRSQFFLRIPFRYSTNLQQFLIFPNLQKRVIDECNESTFFLSFTILLSSVFFFVPSGATCPFSLDYSTRGTERLKVQSGKALVINEAILSKCCLLWDLDWYWEGEVLTVRFDGFEEFRAIN